jgi:hypothetical protein
MNDCASKQGCSLPCPWVGTEHCLLRQVCGTVVEGRHLGYGQMAGLHTFYYPHSLPPCVAADGRLRWNLEDFTTESELAAADWNDDCPGL